MLSDLALLSLQNIMGLFIHSCDMFHYSIIYEHSFIVGPILSLWGFSIEFIVLFPRLHAERWIRDNRCYKDEQLQSICINVFCLA